MEDDARDARGRIVGTLESSKEERASRRWEIRRNEIRPSSFIRGPSEGIPDACREFVKGVEESTIKNRRNGERRERERGRDGLFINIEKRMSNLPSCNINGPPRLVRVSCPGP